MSKQVTFDYSKTGSFISQEEVGYMKKLALDAKEVLVSRSGAGNDFLGFWSSASAALTLGRGRRSNSWGTAFTTCLARTRERRLRFISAATPSAPRI